MRPISPISTKSTRKMRNEGKRWRFNGWCARHKDFLHLCARQSSRERKNARVTWPRPGKEITERTKWFCCAFLRLVLALCMVLLCSCFCQDGWLQIYTRQLILLLLLANTQDDMEVLWLIFHYCSLSDLPDCHTKIRYLQPTCTYKFLVAREYRQLSPIDRFL